VNVSIGGTLTHFAAPPVLMVAGEVGVGHAVHAHALWLAGRGELLGVSTALVAWCFARNSRHRSPRRIPARGHSRVAHARCMCSSWRMVVGFAHHPDVFFGVFMIFLGLVTATREYQDGLKLREGLLVGFFLAGLVTLGSLQSWWLKPLIEGLDGATSISVPPA
jgi:hypothetical protein